MNPLTDQELQQLEAGAIAVYNIIAEVRSCRAIAGSLVTPGRGLTRLATVTAKLQQLEAGAIAVYNVIAEVRNCRAIAGSLVTPSRGLTRLATVTAKATPPVSVHPAPPVDIGATADMSHLPLFGSGGPSPIDIRQGGTSDCYLLADLMGIANERPNDLPQIVVPESPGVYRVAFQRDGTTYWIYVTADLPTNGEETNDSVVLWPALIEKAYCFFRTAYFSKDNSTYTSQNSYASLNDGAPTTAFTDLGYSNAGYFPGPQAWRAAYDAIDLGFPVTALTPSVLPAGSPFQPYHAYEVSDVTVDTSVATFGNPWGFDPVGPLDVATADASLDEVVCATAFNPPAALPLPVPVPPPIPVGPQPFIFLFEAATAQGALLSTPVAAGTPCELMAVASPGALLTLMPGNIAVKGTATTVTPTATTIYTLIAQTTGGVSTKTAIITVK